MVTVAAASTEEHAQVLLRLAELRKTFGGVHALDGISLEIKEGEIRSIIGPNGAGKSTLFGILTGTIRPDRGRIVFGDRDITRLQPFQRARLGLGIKYQSRGVWPDLTVEDNLCIAIQREHRAAGATRRAARGLLAEIGLEGRGDLAARALSHGQRQWLEIMMALGQQPTLLLLDEPTAGMDTDETSRTARMVLSANKRGVTVIVIEHDMAFVREIGGVVTVLHQGRVFAEGTYAEVERDDTVREIYLGRGTR